MIAAACALTITLMRILPFLAVAMAALSGFLHAATAPAAASPNPFFAMDTALRDGVARSPAEQAALLRELGYDGIGTSGHPTDEFLTAFARAGLKVFNTYLTLDFDTGRPGLDPRLRELVPRLRGHGTDLWISINSVTRDGVKLKPSAPGGDAVVLPALQELADLAATNGVRVALYPHTWFWLERAEDAVRLARAAQRPNVGATFNLCHWLKVEGDRDPRPLLQEAGPLWFYVSVNGADAGDTKAMDWNRLIQPLDTGSWDTAGLVGALRGMGYRGPVGFQGYGIPGDSREILRRTMTAWRRMAAVGASTNTTYAGPWNLEALSRPPKWQVLERPKAEGVRAIVYEGAGYQGRTNRVFAWLGVPPVPAGERVPAMVLVHGGGGTAFEEWVRLWVGRGYAAIAMDTCGQLPVGNYGQYFRDPNGGPPGWGGFDQVDAPREDQWTYQAVADVILAHSLIRSLPEVDPERTGVTGISWGGYLTCITAGVDPRFKLAVPVYGCGFYRDTVFAAPIQALGPERAGRWLALWEPALYLGRAAMPFLWVNGSNDFAYPLDAFQRSSRLPSGPRTLCIRLQMPHAHGGAGENPEEIRVFADAVLRGGAPLPAVTGAGRDGASAWVTWSTPVPVVKVELNVTRDTGRWQDRSWEAQPAALNGPRAAASLPDGTRVWYFNLFDERGCVVSSEHVEL